jgi:DeoR/GlpR family transcriptional regulator of sugar metabolism
VLSAERKIRIIEYVKKNKTATISKLAKEFHVHEVTIRRDLASIENEGVVKRTHGGVILNQWSNKELPFDDRTIQNMEQKMRIGEQAASLIAEGDHIIIDSGTTTHYIAKNLKNHKNITVITNDMNIAIELKDSPQIKVILTGGELYPSSYMVNGMFTEQVLRSLRVVKAFVGTPALHPEHGLMHMEAELVPTKQHMIQAAQETIVVTDSSKIGKLALYQVAPLSSIHTLITGKDASQDVIQPVRELGTTVYEV